jgi:predicted O-methyltransferase YrrM
MSTDLPNWFNTTHAYKNFNEFLMPYAGKENIKALQLGSFTGDASIWLLDNILTGEGSHLDDVDLLLCPPELSHLNIDFSEVESIYLSRIKNYKNVSFHKKTTVEVLRNAPCDYYDFIYVDASHDAVDVLIDAELSWFLLKVGGIIAFDDYEWGIDRFSNLRTPKRGVETFHARRRKKLSLVNDPTTQIWLKKERN